ncbi:hypothetical protein PO909_023194 [Leuciscus waleckii]
MSSQLQRQSEFREQCWLSAPTDRKRVNLPFPSQGEWILRNYAQLWDRFSREEPQASSSRSPPSSKLPVISEGRVLAVATLGDQACPTSTPEASSAPVSRRGKRGRRISWESASETSATESALSETVLPAPVTAPAMASAPRPRRRKRRKGASNPLSLSPATASAVPEPATASAVPEPATASAVPEPATASAVPEPAVVSAEEKAAADSAAKAVIEF